MKSITSEKRAFRCENTGEDEGQFFIYPDSLRLDFFTYQVKCPLDNIPIDDIFLVLDVLWLSLISAITKQVFFLLRFSRYIKDVFKFFLLRKMRNAFDQINFLGIIQ